MKRIVIALSVVLALFLTIAFVATSATQVFAAATIATTKTTDMEVLKGKMAKTKKKISNCESVINTASHNSDKWKEAKSDLKIYKTNLSYYRTRLAKLQKYEASTYIWNYLKGKGYNKYVIAGILGNFMAEVGGQTLDLEAYYHDGWYYGVACWSTTYHPNVEWQDLEGQMQYLCKTMKKEINTYGFLYYSGFGFTEFKKLKNEQSAALAFAQTYERCASFSYWQRQQNATKALNYYTK